MSGNTIFNFVPSLYRRFFPAFFHLPVAPERHATCAQCAMVAVDDSPFHGTKHFFSERVKCCTFYPSTPNYLVGALLADISPQSKEGRGRFLHVIKKRIGVTPRGVLTPRRYTALYRLGLEAFGRAESMMCPFLDDAQGLCTVWDYRTALCSSYFCKFNHGQDGWLFWDEFKTYLQFTEQVLASYAMDQGVGTRTRSWEWEQKTRNPSAQRILTRRRPMKSSTQPCGVTGWAAKRSSTAGRTKSCVVLIRGPLKVWAGSSIRFA
jgi:Fe-S-cluster containining protein